MNPPAAGDSVPHTPPTPSDPPIRAREQLRPSAGSRSVARRIAGLLLLAMGAAQLSDLGGFVDVLKHYEVGGAVAGWVLAVLLVAGELSAGILLLAGSAGAHRVGAIAAVIVAAGWSALGLQAFLRGLALENCGCFGVHLAQPLRWWVLVEDLELLLLSIFVLRRARADVLTRARAHPVPTIAGAKT